MASFTDAITQFNPYVAQLPVDAMMKVGMIKQQQYEEGYKKIQGEIDKVAGLDIIRDVDKNYLQSKLDELGSNLKTFAAGDFSNFQLVNSVGGMARQVGKDENVQNAVSSTAWYRKQQKLIEDAKKNGKSSTQNEAWFSEDVSKWYKDPKVGAKFNSEFVQYTDIDKKLRDVADKIHEVDSSIENPYVRDNAGNTLYYKTDKKTGKTTVSTDPNSGGVPKVDDAILAIKVKGKPAEKILAAFYDSLTEDDMRQLKIDGWYHYRGATKDKFKNDITTNYDNKKKLLSDTLTNLNLELKTNTKLTDADKSKIQARINSINTELTNGTIDKEYNKELSVIDQITDEDELTNYKYKLYTQKHLTNLAKDLSYESTQQEYKNNPYAQMAMERKKLQFQYDDANRKHNEFLMNYAQNERHWTADYNYKINKDARDAAGSTPIVTPGRIPTDVDKPDLIKLSSEITSIIGDPKTGKPGLIGELDAKYAPLITDPSVKDKKKYLDGLADAYSKDPSFINDKNIDANMREYLKKRRALDITAALKQALYNSTVDASKVFDEKIDKIIGNETGINFSNGSTLYTAKELYEFAKAAEGYWTSSAGSASVVGSSYTMGTGGGGNSTYFDALGLLEKYKGTKYEPLAKAYYKDYYRDDLTPVESKMVKRSQDLKVKYREVLLQNGIEKLKFQSEYLAQRMPERQTAIGTLSKENKIDMDHVEQLLGRKEIEYSQGGLDVNEKKDYDPDTVASLREKKNVSYSVEKKYDGTANFIVTSGTEKQVIPLTADEFTAYFPNYARTNSINDIKYTVLASPNKTTNLTGIKDGSAAVNAYLSGEDLPQLAGTPLANLVRVDVDGSPFNDGSNRDKFLVRMYVNNNGTWIPRTITPDYVNEATLDYYLKNIGSSTVADVLKGK